MQDVILTDQQQQAIRDFVKATSHFDPETTSTYEVAFFSMSLIKEAVSNKASIPGQTNYNEAAEALNSLILFSNGLRYAIEIFSENGMVKLAGGIPPRKE